MVSDVWRHIDRRVTKVKIKLAILELDNHYISRITMAFNAKFPNLVEIYGFSELSLAIDSIKTYGIDVFIAAKNFDVDISKVPDMCAFAYMVDSPDVEFYKGQKVVFKYQKIEFIYKQILGVYSEKTEWKAKDNSDNLCNVIMFSSPCGGTGTSTVAASASLRLSNLGKKVLYLNLESLGSSDVFFTGNGRYDLSDGIFALKSNTPNLAIKLDGCTKRDDRGVYFFSEPKIAFDTLELNADEILRMVDVFKVSGMFDYIIIDRDFGLKKDDLNILANADSIIWVGDGSVISNKKIERAYKALEVADTDIQGSITKKIMLFINKFNNLSGELPENVNIPNIGRISKYDNNSLEVILDNISKLTMLDKII